MTNEEIWNRLLEFYDNIELTTTCARCEKDLFDAHAGGKCLFFSTTFEPMTGAQCRTLQAGPLRVPEIVMKNTRAGLKRNNYAQRALS